jgi:DNA-binding CsgD family transcriptional regulator
VVYRHTRVSQRRDIHRRTDAALARRGESAVHRAPHIAAGADPEQFEVLVEAAREIVDADPATALRWGTAARTLVRDSDPRWFQAQLLIAHARLLLGQVGGTRDELLAAPGRAARLHELATRLDGDGRSAGPWTDLLTTREREVARLAGSGLSSPDIGRQLFVSTRTVDSHLGRIYRKLGVSNRFALARLVDGDQVTPGVRGPAEE